MLETMSSFSLFGVSVVSWLFSLGAFVLSWAVLRIIEGVLLSRLRKLSKRTKTDIDDTIIAAVGRLFAWPVFLVVSLSVALHVFAAQTGGGLAGTVKVWFRYVSVVVVAFYAVKASLVFVDYGVKRMLESRGDGKKKEVDKGTLQLFSGLVKGAIWGVALVFVLSNLGYNVSSLIAGLGIGGIAVGFALQNILADIFASISIYFDRPFEVGDFIVVGSDMGTVERIGLKSTRIKALQGQELVISNRELTDSRINNYKKMEKRRVVFGFGVTYDTSNKKLEKIPQIVKDVFKSVKGADLDRVHFKSFGDFALNYEVVYYVASGDYTAFMDIQQLVNLELKARLEKAKIEMAFPTQTIYVHKVK